MNPATASPPPITFAVGGGKGGVGKSIFSTLLGVVLAESGRRVALVDLDLGAANLHTYLGITRRTCGLADFLSRKVAGLEELLLPTAVPGLQLISGAEYLPGMANLQHWMKLKVNRHLRRLPVDVVVMDLGAGVAFNTLDFFAIADHGVVLTAPEPAAVMNAYGFIKGALFRQLQQVLVKHPVLGPLIEAQAQLPDEERVLTLDWLGARARDLPAAEAAVVDEVCARFAPHLVLNRADRDGESPIVHNLIALCRQQLGVVLQQQCVLPEAHGIRRHLLNIPGFLATDEGAEFRRRVRVWVESTLGAQIKTAAQRDLSEAQLAQLQQLLDEVDAAYLGGTSRQVWKLRLYFEPDAVINFLLDQGVSDPRLLELVLS